MVFFCFLFLVEMVIWVLEVGLVFVNIAWLGQDGRGLRAKEDMFPVTGMSAAAFAGEVKSGQHQQLKHSSSSRALG